jgi:uncharacterized protein YjbJ (UPF0337 family)
VNKHQVSGKVEQAVGRVKQTVGEILGSDKLANQGVVDQARGAAKETWGNAKDTAKAVRQSHRHAFAPTPASPGVSRPLQVEGVTFRILK